MAAKKPKKQKPKAGKDVDLDGWSKVIAASGERMRSRSAQTREANKERADALRALPLDDIFHEFATQTTSSMADVLRETMEEGPKNGLRETPDAFTVALVRAANFWYQAAKGKS